MRVFHYFILRSGRSINSSNQYKDQIVVTTLSFCRLKQLYGRVNLITDKLGKDVLVDQIELPYAETQVLPDIVDDPIGHSLALFEFLSVQGDCFLLVNYNIILTGRCPEPGPGGIIFLSRSDDEYYVETLYQMWSYSKSAVQFSVCDRVFNRGVLGTNPRMIAIYLAEVKFMLTTYGDLTDLTKASIIGKFLLKYYWTYFVDQRDIQFRLLTDSPSLPELYRKPYQLLNELEEGSGFIEVSDELGINPVTATLLAFKLRQDWPQFYKTIQETAHPLRSETDPSQRFMLDSPSAYSRTRAALDVLLHVTAERIRNDQDLIAYMKSLKSNDLMEYVTYQLVNDVYAFESARDLFRQTAEFDPFIDKKIVQLDAININPLRFEVSPHVSTIESEWSWSTAWPDEVDPDLMALLKVKYNSTELPSYHQAVLWLNTYRNSVEEYPLNSLSILLIHYLTEGTALQEAVEQTSVHYNAQEQLSEFRALVHEQIQDLIAHRLLSIVDY